MIAPPSFLAASLYVALGGGLGSWLRFLAGKLVGPTAFPWGTLAINVAGSFAMGLLAGWLVRQGETAEGWRLLLGVGVLGGFTTFSAFSLEIAQLAQRGATGAAALYAGGSVVLGIIGLFTGLALMRSLA